jgi:hypothetical protein
MGQNAGWFLSDTMTPRNRHFKEDDLPDGVVVLDAGWTLNSRETVGVVLRYRAMDVLNGDHMLLLPSRN